jgi:arsenate reductase (glutaredoxin)
MTDQITVYEKPTCTKCRQVNKMLTECGFEFSKVNYYIEPLTANQLKDLLRKLGMQASDLLRMGEDVYRELGLSKAEKNEEELIELMVKHPDLIQRPIVERGSKAVLGRPPENIKALLN